MTKVLRVEAATGNGAMTLQAALDEADKTGVLRVPSGELSLCVAGGIIGEDRENGR